MSGAQIIGRDRAQRVVSNAPRSTSSAREVRRCQLNSHRDRSSWARPLVLAAGGVLALTVLHDLDHLRQGRDLPLALDLIGGAATLGAVGIFLWSARRANENVARVAEVFGFTTAVGLVVVHVLPHWSLISDPYDESGVDALSWLSLMAFIAGGIILGVVAHRHEPSPGTTGGS